MKRVWRYFVWLYSDMSWFEWFISGIWFFCGAGVMATIMGDEKLRNVWFSLALVVASILIVILMYKGFRHSWNSFKEDDEKVFNILKDKHNGQ